MSAHILVTGGAGFIGSHLTRRLLDRSDRVTILDDFNDFYEPARKRANVARVADSDGFSLVEGDIRDADLVDQLFRDHQFDAVVHLAARAGVRPSLKEPILYEDTNCIGTLRLLEAARQWGPEKFIFGSSSSVYGINEKVPFAESDEINQPISPYATTKRTGELLCYNYYHLVWHAAFGLSAVLFTVYGPAQRPEMAIHKFTDLLARGETIPLYGDGQQSPRLHLYRRHYRWCGGQHGSGATVRDSKSGRRRNHRSGGSRKLDRRGARSGAEDRAPTRSAGRCADYLCRCHQGWQVARLRSEGAYSRRHSAIYHLVSAEYSLNRETSSNLQ